jgi:radical SAM superfamily enzyme YgiQ (UPF0313 family)
LAWKAHGATVSTASNSTETGKRASRTVTKRAIQKIQSHGITVNGCFIMGLDGDTPEVFDDVLNFVRDSGLYEVQVTFLTAFPGTPL